MASISSRQQLTEQTRPGYRARVLLVNEDPGARVYYHTALRKLGCHVRLSSSFAEGVQCLGHEPYELVFLDQGSSLFEGREVLARAMEIDPEIRVLILARSYNQNCFLQAMQSGALEYFEKPLGETDIAALLDTFIPSASRAQEASVCRALSSDPEGSATPRPYRRGRAPREVFEKEMRRSV